MLKRDIIEKQRLKDIESIDVLEYKSNLKHTQFHDYMDNSYDKWKWFFNYVKDAIINDDYIKELNISLKDTTTVVDSMLKDTVSPRVVEIDKTVLPDTIEATLGRMQSYHTKNQNAISELNISDDLKEKLNDWNDAVYALVVDIKKKINESIVVIDNEGYAKDFITNLKAKLNNTEEMETTKGTYVAIDVENHEQLFNWFKDQGIEPIVSTEMHCTIAYSRVEFNIDNYIGRIIIKPEQFIGIEELGNEGCAVLKYNSDELQSRFNTCMSAGATYDYDTYIPHTTFALNLTKEQISKLKVPNFDIVLVGEYTDELNIEWKSKINKDEESIMDKKNKTSYIVSGELSTIVSDPIAYMDSEAFSAISGLAANGFKKVSDIVSEIIDGFTPSVPDYSKLTKGFIFDKGKRFQDIYSTTVGVPAGYTGYILDVSKYVVDNLHYINTLNKELDNTINILSMYINSADYRESFILDLTAVKAIESIATDLFNSNKKYITASKEDSKPIGKLLRSASEVDDVVDNLKEAGSLLDLKTLDTIKFKMKQVDDLISTMIDNKNVYSKNKLMEIAKLIDAIISLSNGVATIVYLKNSTDIILEDIRVVL